MAEASNRRKTTEEAHRDSVVLKVKTQIGRDGHYRFSCNKQIKYLLMQHCRDNSLEYLSLKFFHDGEPVIVSKTPAELGLVNGDVIDVLGQQDGGGFQGDAFN